MRINKDLDFVMEKVYDYVQDEEAEIENSDETITFKAIAYNIVRVLMSSEFNNKQAVALYRQALKGNLIKMLTASAIMMNSFDILNDTYILNFIALSINPLIYNSKDELTDIINYICENN